METTKKFSTYTKTIIALGFLLIILISFGIGMAVGYNRAFRSHGAKGEIISATPPTFFMRNRYNDKQAVLISTSTNIRYLRAPAQSSDLRPGAQVIVIGEPDQDSRIRARFIRIISPINK